MPRATRVSLAAFAIAAALAAQDPCSIRLNAVFPRHLPPIDLSDLLPSGTRTIAGVIVARSASSILIRTADGHHLAVTFAPHTRWIDQGQTASADDLRPNTHVYIRGGTDLDGRLKADQVSWGDILEPAGQP